MAHPTRSDEDLRFAAQVYLEHDRNYTQAARAIDWNIMTFKRHVREAARKGMLGTDAILPGFSIARTSETRNADGEITSTSVTQKPDAGEDFQIPEGHRIKGLSTLTDGQGRIVSQWTKTTAGELDPEAAAERIAETVSKYNYPAPVIPEPLQQEAGCLTLYPLADLHLGLYAWGGEAATNWDLATAERVYRETMTMVAQCSPPSAHAVVLGGGDYLHANTNEFRTESGNVLDGDGRTDKVIDAAIELAIFQIEMALAKHGEVTARFLKGNHDQYAVIAIVYALAERYRNEPRVTIDKDASLFWWHRFGRVLLGASHGHTIKIRDFPMIMANRVPQEWGATEFRYGHLFHVHHKTQHIFEGGGVISESHQSPVAQAQECLTVEMLDELLKGEGGRVVVESPVNGAGYDAIVVLDNGSQVLMSGMVRDGCLVGRPTVIGTLAETRNA